MHLLVILIIGATIFVAYANGANDNFLRGSHPLWDRCSQRQSPMGCRSKYRPGLGVDPPVAALLAGGVFAVLQDLVCKR